MAVSLDKGAVESIRVSLEKKGILEIPEVDVAFDLDVSGSYKDEHRSGITTDLMTRLVPWGLLLDPDKKLDAFTFSDGMRHAYYVGEVNEQNYAGYVMREIWNKVPGWCGMTTYTEVIQRNLAHFGWIPPIEPLPPVQHPADGVKNPAILVPALPRKSLIIFNTDGANSRDDQTKLHKLFQRMEKEEFGVYVMFIGVSNQPGEFRFLQEVADRYSNCGLVVVRDVKRWVTQSNEELNAVLITDELIAWLKK